MGLVPVRDKSHPPNLARLCACCERRMAQSPMLAAQNAAIIPATRPCAGPRSSRRALPADETGALLLQDYLGADRDRSRAVGPLLSEPLRSYPIGHRQPL